MEEFYRSHKRWENGRLEWNLKHHLGRCEFMSVFWLVLKTTWATWTWLRALTHLPCAICWFHLVLSFLKDVPSLILRMAPSKNDIEFSFFFKKKKLSYQFLSCLLRNWCRWVKISILGTSLFSDCWLQNFENGWLFREDAYHVDVFENIFSALQLPRS